MIFQRVPAGTKETCPLSSNLCLLKLAHRAGLVPLARLHGSASHQEHRYQLHRSPEIRAHAPPVRFPVSTCPASCPAFPRWRPRIHLTSARLVVQPASSACHAVASAKAGPPFPIAGRAPTRYVATDAPSHSALPQFRVRRNFFG